MRVDRRPNICGTFSNRTTGSTTDRGAHDDGSGGVEDAQNFECRAGFTALA